MKIEILDEAQQDLIEGFHFYGRKEKIEEKVSGTFVSDGYCKKFELLSSEPSPR